MSRWKCAVAIVGLQALFLAGIVGEAQAQLIPSPDGLTVYDTGLHVNWLRNANLAGTPGNAVPGAPAVDPGGAMSFDTALAWVAALNAANYLGHNTWSMPTSPHVDRSCSLLGPLGNSFGYGCTGSALGSFYANGLQLVYPDTAIRIPDTATGPFHNFRPNYYWSNTGDTDPSGNNWRTFSFNTGVQGGNIGVNYMRVLPMMDGQICTHRENGHELYCPTFVPSGVGNLKVPDDGRGLVVYDPDAIDPETNVQGVTWVADANLAQSRKFGAQCAPADNAEIPAPCITDDGAMSHTTAAQWIDGMNTFGGHGWLGSTSWKLPPIFAVDNSCDDSRHLGCTRSPMGKLYYTQLGFAVGEPVVPTPNRWGANLQQYLYWSCSGSLADPRVCDADPHADPPSLAVPGLPSDEFGWSFSFGNGFQGTENVSNHLYVMVYYPESVRAALTEALNAALGDDPQYANALAWFEAQATAIAAETGARKERDLRTFIRVVNAGRGSSLTNAEADQIIALARAL